MIPLPRSSGVTCMLRVKDQVSFVRWRNDLVIVIICSLLILLLMCGEVYTNLSAIQSLESFKVCHLSTGTSAWCAFVFSDLGRLSSTEVCWRSVWRPAVGSGPREPCCSKGAARPFRQHSDSLLCRGSLRPQWLCVSWWQDRYLEGRVKTEKRLKRETSTEVEEGKKSFLNTKNMLHVLFLCFNLQ